MVFEGVTDVDPALDEHAPQTSAGRVLVLDAERRQGIVAIRNLGRHGIGVTAGSSAASCPGGFSKYATRRIQYPSPEDDEAAFLDALETELRTRSYDALIPVTLPTASCVVRNRDRLEPHAPIPYPPYETLLVGLDKKHTVDAARAADVPVPRTLAPRSLNIDAVESSLDYPVIVKPRRESGGDGVVRCESPAELETAFERISGRFGPPLIQEYVPNGGEVGVYTLYDWSSTLVGVTVQRRLRTKPPDGGASTLRETIEAPELVSLTDELFTDLDWQGLAMAEYRIDARTGKPKLLEVNPRFWGSLALSVQAGVEFPYLLYRLATDGTCEPALDYRVGVQTRYLFGDLGHLLMRDDRLAAVREFLAPVDAPRGYDVLSRDDPGAALGFAIYVTAAHLGWALRKL